MQQEWIPGYNAIPVRWDTLGRLGLQIAHVAQGVLYCWLIQNVL
jgi:hypothetical protein